VNRVVSHGDLIGEAMASARLIAEAEPRVVSAALALYRRGESATLDEALQFEQEAADAWRTDASRSRADFDRLTGH